MTPACPYCGSDDTYLFDVFFTQPVWECLSPDCTNVEFEHFFDKDSLKEKGMAQRYKAGDIVTVEHDSDRHQPWDGLWVRIEEVQLDGDPWDYFITLIDGTEDTDDVTHGWFDDWELGEAVTA